MKLATKLLLAPIAAAVVALGTGGASFVMNERLAAQQAERFAADLGSVQAVAAAQLRLAEANASIYRTQAIIASYSPEQLAAFRRGLREQLDGVQALLIGLGEAAAGDAELGGAIGEGVVLLESYRTQADKAIELTDVEINMGVAAMQAAERTFSDLGKRLQAVVDRRDTLQAEHQAESERAAWAAMLLLGLLALLAICGAMTFAWVQQRRIVGDVQQAVGLASDVAAGRLDRQTDSQRSDEIGELLRSLDTMTARLRESLQTVRLASDSIRTASQEIATGNSDLSHRTEQAASSLQQTASSMEQLSGTVTQTADSARTANQLAASASSVANRGGTVVAQVVSTMDEINTSSRKIADIIGTIDGIAFQTNILALNAAVEAARAGEQGRGFAVVASEVRSLAQRSAEAAKQIKGLIQASVEKVDSGSRLVGEAGTTMNEIVASVQRVTDIIGEISAAAAEQSGGLGQINGAVNELDRATQQNAALVEESAAAAESLREQAGRLAEVVGRFQLGAHERVVSPAPAASAPAAAASAVIQRVRREAPAAATAAPPVRAVQGAGPARGKAGSGPAQSPAPQRVQGESAASPKAGHPAPAQATTAAGGQDDWESF
jgi:methyl-accepting chemotaxis protein